MPPKCTCHSFNEWQWKLQLVTDTTHVYDLWLSVNQRWWMLQLKSNTSWQLQQLAFCLCLWLYAFIWEHVFSIQMYKSVRDRMIFPFYKCIKSKVWEPQYKWMISHTSGGRSFSGDKCNAITSSVWEAEVMNVSISSLSSDAGETLNNWNITSRMGCTSLCFTIAWAQLDNKLV
jgi:hypothetical protein